MSTKYRKEEVLGCYVVLSVVEALKNEEFLNKFEGISKRFMQEDNEVDIGGMRSFLIKTLASGGLDDACFDALEEIFDSPVVKLVQLFNKNSSEQIEEFTTKSSSERNYTFLQKHAAKIEEMCKESSDEFVDNVYHLCEDMLSKLKREQNGGGGSEGENGGGGGENGGGGGGGSEEVPGAFSVSPAAAAAHDDAAAAPPLGNITPVGVNTEPFFTADPYSIMGFLPERHIAAWQAGIVYCDCNHLFGVPLSSAIGACHFAIINICLTEAQSAAFLPLTMTQAGALLYPGAFACGLCCCCLGKYLNVAFTRLQPTPDVEIEVLAIDRPELIVLNVQPGQNIIQAMQPATYVSRVPGGSSSKTLYTNNRKTKRKQHIRRQRKHTHHKKKRLSKRKRRTKRT